MMGLIKNVFNHYFVIDVKFSIFWNDNCLYDPSTITQLINKKVVNQKEVTRAPRGKVEVMLL